LMELLREYRVNTWRDKGELYVQNLFGVLVPLQITLSKSCFAIRDFNESTLPSWEELKLSEIRPWLWMYLGNECCLELQNYKDNKEMPPCLFTTTR